MISNEVPDATKGDESPHREIAGEIGEIVFKTALLLLPPLYRPCEAYRYAHALSKARFIVSNVDSVTAE